MLLLFFLEHSYIFEEIISFKLRFFIICIQLAWILRFVINIFGKQFILHAGNLLRLFLLSPVLDPQHVADQAKFRKVSKGQDYTSVNLKH